MEFCFNMIQDLHTERGLYRMAVQTKAATTRGNLNSLPCSPLTFFFSHGTDVRSSGLDKNQWLVKIKYCCTRLCRSKAYDPVKSVCYSFHSCRILRPKPKPSSILSDPPDKRRRSQYRIGVVRSSDEFKLKPVLEFLTA